MTESVELSDRDWAGIRTKVQRYVRRRVGGSHVEDVVGDTMLRLVRHAGKLDEVDSGDAWIKRVASTAVIDFYRSQGAHKRLKDAVARDGGIEETVSPPEPATAPESLSKCMHPLIDKLPEHYAAALRLTEIEGLSMREAAERLGLSLTGLKSRVQRGRAQIRQGLTRCCTVETNKRGEVLDYRPRTKTSCSEI